MESWEYILAFVVVALLVVLAWCLYDNYANKESCGKAPEVPPAAGSGTAPFVGRRSDEVPNFDSSSLIRDIQNAERQADEQRAEQAAIARDNVRKNMKAQILNDGPNVRLAAPVNSASFASMLNPNVEVSNSVIRANPGSSHVDGFGGGRSGPEFADVTSWNEYLVQDGLDSSVVDNHRQYMSDMNRLTTGASADQVRSADIDINPRVGLQFTDYRVPIGIDSRVVPSSTDELQEGRRLNW